MTKSLIANYEKRNKYTKPLIVDGKYTVHNCTYNMKRYIYFSIHFEFNDGLNIVALQDIG